MKLERDLKSIFNLPLRTLNLVAAVSAGSTLRHPFLPFPFSMVHLRFEITCSVLYLETSNVCTDSHIWLHTGYGAASSDTRAMIALGETLGYNNLASP